jgi:hypothetical protein
MTAKAVPTPIKISDAFGIMKKKFSFSKNKNEDYLMNKKILHIVY